MMDIDTLRSFVAVVDNGGFNSAATALGVAQPSLTRRIQRLEAGLGTKLLHRGPWGVELTEDGATFCEGARRVLALTYEVIAETTGASSRVIRLGAAATAAGSYLAPRLAAWLPRHPEVHLEMIEDGARNMRSRLEQRDCDMGVVASPIPEHFASRFITTVNVQALLPVKHRLARTEGPLRVGDLHGERVLVNGTGFLSTDLLLSACRLASSEPVIIYESSVGQTLAALAEGGIGIAIMGDSVDLRGFDLPRRYVCEQDGPPLTFDLHLAWLRDRRLSPTARQLVETLTGSSPNTA